MKITGDLSVTSARSNARHGWNAGWVFRNGGQGAWYDPSDLSTLFQDAAGTIAVTGTGQPVGRMLDKSGHGRNATQTTASARPIYRTNGQKHWLEFDGVDDFMRLSAPLDLDTGTVVMALTEPPGRTHHSILLSPTGAGYITISGSGTRSLSKNALGSIVPVDSPTTFAMTAETAVGIRVSGQTLHARRWPDSTEHVNSTAASANLETTNTLMAFSSGGELPARVDLFGLLLCSDALPPNTYARALSWMNTRIAL